MTRTAPRTGLIAALLALAPAYAGAQRTYVISSDVSCGSCRIELRHVVTLGGSEGRHVFGPPTVLEHDARGRYDAAFSVTPGEVTVFDSTGTDLTTIGREGDGPGEYRHIAALVPARGDMLHVFDPVLRRRTVLSPDYDVIEVDPMNAVVTPHGALVLTDGRVLVQALVPTRSAIGQPLHLLRGDGSIARSYGAVEPDTAFATAAANTMRWVSLADDGAVWTVPGSAYRLELWDTTGARLMELTRKVDWFDGWYDDAPRDPADLVRRGPAPQMGSIWYDSRGLLWTVARVPDEEWRDVAPADGPDGPQFGPETFNDRYDTLIEAIDVRRHRLVASARVDPMILAVTHDGCFYSYGETADGQPFIDVWRVALTVLPMSPR